MISCTEFIPSYSELFSFLEEEYGYAEVERYWNDIFDPDRNGILNQKVARLGLRGCYEYWAMSLNEEAADFTMYLNEADGWFMIQMHRCPSKGRLLDLEQIRPYPRYCLHCDMYRKTVERYGLRYQYDFTQTGRAACSSLIYDPARFQGKMVLTDGTLVMDRRAADNKYLHRDFHLYMNMGVDYLGRKFGGAVVDAYLARYAKGYLRPLAEKIRTEGLPALQENIAATYAAEEAPEAVHLERRGNRLDVRVEWCPGVRHIRNRSEPVSPWYSRTTTAVMGTLAGETGLQFSMDAYHEQTGAAAYHFITA